MRVLIPFFVTLAISGCSGGGSGAPMGGGGVGNGSELGSLACAEQEFAIVGTLDGSPVSHRGAITGHAWIQASTSKTLDVPFEGGGSLHAEWQDVVADGQIFVASGTIVLPSSGPHGGETLNADSGQMRKVDALVDFEFTALSVDVVCVTAPCPADAVEGTLEGCVRWRPL